jgi:accessory Sec system S-layer assembly protein
MFSFFRKKNEKIEKLGEDSFVDSTAIIGVSAQGVSSDIDVKTNLSFHPEMNIGTEERYYFQFLHNELPPLKQNQISIAGIEIKEVFEEWHVVAFIRNGLAKSIQFEDLPLVLVGPNGETIGKKEFPLGEVGEIPPASSRPWVFVFHPQELNVTDIPEKGWRLTFETKPKHQLDLDESWENNISAENKEGLTRLLYSMGPPNPGQINIVGINAEQLENGDIHVTVLIGNGHQQDIELESIILYLEDATGEVVAKGGFKLNPLTVKADTSKPWTFIYPKGILLKDSVDFTTWKVYPAQ